MNRFTIGLRNAFFYFSCIFMISGFGVLVAAKILKSSQIGRMGIGFLILGFTFLAVVITLQIYGKEKRSIRAKKKK